MRPRTLDISQGKIISCFSPLQGGWGKTTHEGGLQPPLHIQRHSEEHKHFPPTEITLHPYVLSNFPVYLIASAS